MHLRWVVHIFILIQFFSLVLVQNVLQPCWVINQICIWLIKSEVVLMLLRHVSNCCLIFLWDLQGHFLDRHSHFPHTCILFFGGRAALYSVASSPPLGRLRRLHLFVHASVWEQIIHVIFFRLLLQLLWRAFGRRFLFLSWLCEGYQFIQRHFRGREV